MEFNKNINTLDNLIKQIKINENFCSILNFVDKNFDNFKNYSQIPFFYLKKQKKEKENYENININ